MGCEGASREVEDDRVAAPLPRPAPPLPGGADRPRPRPPRSGTGSDYIGIKRGLKFCNWQLREIATFFFPFLLLSTHSVDTPETARDSGISMRC